MPDTSVLERREIEPAQIATALPHRGHALFPSRCWFDGAEEGRIRGGGSASWSADHPVLQGHFPGLPIVPGVFLIEAAAQIAGVLIDAAREPGSAGAGAGRIGVLSSVKKVLVHSPALPGQRIDYRLELRRVGGDFYQVTAIGCHEERKVATLEMSIGIVERAQFI